MKVYHCGASSKDAGNRITTITRLADIDDYKATIRGDARESAPCSAVELCGSPNPSGR